MKDLIKKEDAALSYEDNLVREAKNMSGEFLGSKIPYIPIIKINNKTEKKIVKVDGEDQTVKIPPKKGFLITKKNPDTGRYESNYFTPELKAAILKARYQIESKIDYETSFYSEEFDNWKQNIKVFARESNEIIQEGSYSELKEIFKTEEIDSYGHNKKHFNIFLVLYIAISKDIFRFKWKMSGYNKWFDYTKEFGENETYVGCLTEFELYQERKGDIDFWYVKFKKGEKDDLTKNIALQKELQKFFNISSIVREANKEETIIEQFQPEEEDIRLDTIPF